jgi:Putative F0F1-ATPase subunit Ca2+/Mg2+ transporter
VSDKPSPNGYALIGLGVTLAVCVVGGLAGGHWLDDRFRTGVLLTFVGLAVGIAVAATVIYSQFKKYT